METYIHIQIKQDSMNDFWRHLSEVVNLALERHRESFVEANTETSNLKSTKRDFIQHCPSTLKSTRATASIQGSHKLWRYLSHVIGLALESVYHCHKVCAERLVFYCRTSGASTASCTSNGMCCPTHCVSDCAPCQPLSREISGWRSGHWELQFRIEGRVLRVWG